MVNFSILSYFVNNSIFSFNNFYTKLLNGSFFPDLKSALIVYLIIKNHLNREVNDKKVKKATI